MFLITIKLSKTKLIRIVISEDLIYSPKRAGFLERARGITIFSKQAMFDIGETQITRLRLGFRRSDRSHAE